MEKNKLRKYCNDGLSSRKIAEIENVSQTTIRYWLKIYSLKTIRKAKYNINELRKIIAESKSRNEVFTKLNRNNSSGAYKSLNKIITEYKIDISHFMSVGDNLKQSHQQKEITNDEMFCENGKNGRATIKRRILRDNLLKYKCFNCGQGNKWLNKNLVLILDHKNGINNDNRLKNLRFVCPNCNSQLPTHCNKKRTCSSIG